MDFNKLYIIQIITALLLLLCISIFVLYDKFEPIDYNYKELISIQENYDSVKSYYNYQKNVLEKYQKSDFDEKGILLTKVNDEKIYHIANISYYGLMLYSRYVEENNPQDLEIAKKQADYLVEYQNKENGALYEVYEYDVYGTNEKMGEFWVSATTQGQALSLLSRMYNVTKEEKYKTACELALIPFTKSITENGICTNFFGYAYYEDFQTEKPTYSLRGFLYSLLGLYDCYAISGNETAKQLYDEGIKTLEMCLPYYEYNGISLNNLNFMNYDRTLKIYNEESHRIHIALLETINQKENNEIIQYFIETWRNYVTESK